MFRGLMRHPDVGPMDDATVHLSNKSLLVICARALYNAAQRDGVTEKCSGIEVLSLRERLSAMPVSPLCVGSPAKKQFSDDFTKPSARQVLADRARKDVLKHVHDPRFVAAKRKSSSQRAANIQTSTLHRRAAQVLALFSFCLVCGQAQACTVLTSSPSFHELCAHGVHQFVYGSACRGKLMHWLCLA